MIIIFIRIFIDFCLCCIGEVFQGFINVFEACVWIPDQFSFAGLQVEGIRQRFYIANL